MRPTGLAAKPLGAEVEQQQAQHEYVKHERAPSSPCSVMSFADEAVPEMHLDGENGGTITLAGCDVKMMGVGSLLAECCILTLAYLLGAALLTAHTSGVLALDLFLADSMCMAFNTALLVGVGLKALQINHERCVHAHAAREASRAQWVCDNTPLSPAVIAERRRLLLLGVCLGGTPSIPEGPLTEHRQGCA
jgi:hypothetical protein